MTAPPVRRPEECIYRQARGRQDVHRSGIIGYREGSTLAKRRQFDEAEDGRCINAGCTCKLPVHITFRISAQSDDRHAAALQ